MKKEKNTKGFDNKTISHLKIFNKELSVPRLICNLINRHGYSSNPQIAQKFDLSLPTALAYSKELIENGVIIINGKCKSNGGKKANKLTFNPNYSISIGIDLRQSSFIICAIDFSNNKLLNITINEPFSFNLEYFKIVQNAFSDFINNLTKKYPNINLNKYLGISVPAGIIQRPLKAQSHALKLNWVDFGEYLNFKDFLPFLINDSNAGALAETAFYSNNESFIYLSLGKTVGSGIVALGKLMEGLNNRTGEVGHMSLIAQGRLCYCGKEGCVDPYLNEESLLFGLNEDLGTFFSKIKNQFDSTRLARLEKYIKYLSLLINNLNNLLDVKIILGGTIGPYLYDYLDLLDKELSQISSYPFEDIIIKANVIDQPSAYGAAFAARDRLIKDM